MVEVVRLHRAVRRGAAVERLTESRSVHLCEVLRDRVEGLRIVADLQLSRSEQLIVSIAGHNISLFFERLNGTAAIDAWRREKRFYVRELESIKALRTSLYHGA